jgi:hypothetical protein
MPHLERGERRPDYGTFLIAYEHAWLRYQADPTPHHLAVLQAGEEILMRELFKPGKFELGQLVMTPGADRAMHTAGHIPPEFLLRHKNGDWGELPAEDVQENEWSLQNGARLFSAYATRREESLWVITEWDRTATTLLLPEEY